MNTRKIKFQQESPPAWTQEAYRPPCSKYSLCCPNWVPPRPGVPPPVRVPPGQGTPPARVPPGQGTPQPWYPPSQGTPPARVPPLVRVPPQPGYPPSQGTPPGWTWQGTPPAAPWHSGKCCKALWDTGTPPCGQTEGQTRVKTLPSLVLRTRAVINLWNYTFQSWYFACFIFMLVIMGNS